MRDWTAPLHTAGLRAICEVYHAGRHCVTVHWWCTLQNITEARLGISLYGTQLCAAHVSGIISVLRRHRLAFVQLQMRFVCGIRAGIYA